jgi:hypothetical protein
MNWSRERWRKLYLRESLQQRLLPLMARGIRDYLIRLAEDDGTLIDDADDPVAELVRALGAHESEVELARQAVELLRRDGFLAGGPRSLIIRNLEAAQSWPGRLEAPAVEQASVEVSASSSAERVRRHRERKREAARAAVDASNTGASVSGVRVPVTPSVTSGVTSGVTGNVSPVTSGVSVGVTGNVSPVTSGVSPSVTSSRGFRNLNSSESFLDNQRSRKDHLHPSSARASGVTSSVTCNVSSKRFSNREDEDEGDEFHRSVRLRAQGRASSRGPPMPISECLLPLLKTAR